MAIKGILNQSSKILNIVVLAKRMFFLFLGYHIQNCRSSEKIDRKEIILRFFFPSRFGTKKKKPGGKRSSFDPDGCVFFQVLGFRSNLVDGFFFRTKIPRGKEKA